MAIEDNILVASPIVALKFDGAKAKIDAALQEVDPDDKINAVLAAVYLGGNITANYLNYLLSGVVEDLDTTQLLRLATQLPLTCLSPFLSAVRTREVLEATPLLTDLIIFTLINRNYKDLHDALIRISTGQEDKLFVLLTSMLSINHVASTMPNYVKAYVDSDESLNQNSEIYIEAIDEDINPALVKYNSYIATGVEPLVNDANDYTSIVVNRYIAVINNLP